jgi:hypothetical protein
VDKILNPLRLNPISGSVKSADKDINAMINGVLRGIDRMYRASEAYELAAETQIIAGVGYLQVVIEPHPILKGKNVIGIKGVRNPTSVLWDPFSEAIDGSDARQCAIMTWIDRDVAITEYGDEAVSGDIRWLYGQLTPPANAVGDVTFYEMIEESSKEEESTETTEEIGSKGKKCRITRFVGSKQVAQVEYECEWLLVVPVFGDRCWLDDGFQWTGMVYKNRDNQNLINLYASNELELASLAPKSPFIAAHQQVQGYEKYWRTANIEAHSFLPYNALLPNGQVMPPPQRADNTAQTSGVMQSKMQSVEMSSKLLGVPDVAFGGLTAMSESGSALRTRLAAADVTNAQYIDNLSKSVEQVIKIEIALMRQTYVGIQPVEVVDARGVSDIAEIDVSAALTDEVRAMLSVEIASGPSFESRRQEEQQSLRDLATMGGPEVAAMTIDLIAESFDSPTGDKLAARLRRLRPELNDNADEDEEGIPPEAKAALDQATATIEKLEEAVKYLEGKLGAAQAEVANKDKEIDKDIYIAELRAKTELEKQAMADESRAALEAMKAQIASMEEALKVINAQQMQSAQAIDSVEMPVAEPQMQQMDNLIGSPELPMNIIERTT